MTKGNRTSAPLWFYCIFCVLWLLAPPSALSQAPFSAEDELGVKRAWECDISPDGKWIAYTVRRMRPAKDPAGSDYLELHVVSTSGGQSRPFVTGSVSVSSPRWSPDGTKIAFRLKRSKDDKTQVWVIPADGGEAAAATRSKTDVLDYRWHPDGHDILYVATAPPSAREKELSKRGFGFTYFEENLKHRELFRVSASGGDANCLLSDVTVWTFEVDPRGRGAAIIVSDRNLIDERYIASRIDYLNFDKAEHTLVVDPPGKLGTVAFSPDGGSIAYCAARSQNDHATSQLYVVSTDGGEPRTLTPRDFRGHIDWVGWRDRNQVLFRAAEGVETTLNAVPARGGQHRVILDSREAGVTMGTPSYTREFDHVAMTGSAHDVPRDLYIWTPGRKLRRLTTLNPWLAERQLGEREIVRYSASDGLELEGILYLPVGYQEGARYPLIVLVHGGPESRYANQWNSSYSTPTQVLAGKGYAVFLPNYRSSTGYGPEQTATTLGDPAGREFDDIADGIDYLVERGIADAERVGLGGGSYGGYAAAWFSSYYTEKVRAVCMFVGISNLLSKRGTTDIPYEELYVHSGKRLEDMWELSLERSPIYHAAGSRTAVLIYGGASDSRVHPSQSIEYFRRLKMNAHPAVRLVQYPGEGHGNSKQPGKIDVLYRIVDWYDWYVRDQKSLDGPMPPLDISDRYGLKLDKEDTSSPADGSDDD